MPTVQLGAVTAGSSYLSGYVARPDGSGPWPGVGHSFLNDAPNGPAPLRPLLKVMKVGPEPASAADAWRRIEAFFAEHLAS